LNGYDTKFLWAEDVVECDPVVSASIFLDLLSLHSKKTGVSSALHMFGKRQHAVSATSRPARYEVPGVEAVSRGERGEKLSTKALSLGRPAKLVGAPRAHLPEGILHAQRAI
jgi:hypothetical protein